MTEEAQIKSLKKARKDLLDELEVWGYTSFTKQEFFNKMTEVDAAIKKLEPSWTTLFTDNTQNQQQ